MTTIRLAVTLLIVAVAGACAPADTDDLRVAATATTTTDIATTVATPATQPATSTITVSTTTSTLEAPTTTLADTTTTAHITTTTLGVTGLPDTMYCRDLDSSGFTYVEAVEYWIRHGRPDRMDADRNGIPCETVYPEPEVLAFWGYPLPTTTVVAGPYVVIEPTYFPPSEPGSGDALGSGCSPGTASLPDGIWFGRIVEATPTSVEFDLMCFEPAPPEQEEIAAITNTSTALRTVPIADGAIVYALSDDGPLHEQFYETWHTEPGPDAFCPPEGCWDVWLYVNGGKVTEVVQLWFA